MKLYTTLTGAWTGVGFKAAGTITLKDPSSPFITQQQPGKIPVMQPLMDMAGHRGNYHVQFLRRAEHDAHCAAGRESPASAIVGADGIKYPDAREICYRDPIPHPHLGVGAPLYRIVRKEL